MNMTSVQLPELPKGREFEEYVSSYFQILSYYVERNIIERELDEVLELDIITTDYSNVPPEVNLTEVKSSKWKYRDLFTVKGWMDYLDIENGYLIAKKEGEHLKFAKSKAEELSISLKIFPEIDEPQEILSKFNCDKEFEELGVYKDISVWRFSYWVERNLLKLLKHKKSSHPDKKRYRVLDKYHFKVNSEIFFPENVLKKLDSLYSVFQEYPYLSAKVGHALKGEAFKKDYEKIPNEIYKDTYYQPTRNDVQISTFIEHKARLAILKCAVDYKLYEIANAEGKIKDEVKLELQLGEEIFNITLLDTLPNSFKEGVEEMSKHEYFSKYPVFWQWFLWLFGGFILKDYKQQEYELLSKKTGIPVKEIPKALEVYNLLFPREDGWFMDLSPQSNIKLLRMFSVPFMGIGSHYRKVVYSNSADGDFKDLDLSGNHTAEDLTKWKNLTVELLDWNN